MATIEQQLNQLTNDKKTLVDNLVTQGVEATKDETFTSLVPKVLDIETGGGDVKINDAGYLFYDGCRVNQIEEICNILNPDCTNFESMYALASALTNVPQINTSKGTTFRAMYHQCGKLTSIPEMDTSNGTDFYQMFRRCYLIQTIPPLDTSKGTTFYSMFEDNNSMISIPLLDMGKCNDCAYLVEGCTALVDLAGFKNLGKGFTKKTANYYTQRLNLSSCSQLTHDSLMNVINNLYDLNLTYNVANGGTLYTQSLILGSTNLAKLTPEEIAIATNKGWTVS